jgi:hypothetical protein
VEGRGQALHLTLLQLYVKRIAVNRQDRLQAGSHKGRATTVSTDSPALLYPQQKRAEPSQVPPFYFPPTTKKAKPSGFAFFISSASKAGDQVCAKLAADPTEIKALCSFDVLCLWAFLALSYSEGNFLTFNKSLKA